MINDWKNLSSRGQFMQLIAHRGPILLFLSGIMNSQPTQSFVNALMSLHHLTRSWFNRNTLIDIIKRLWFIVRCVCQLRLDNKWSVVNHWWYDGCSNTFLLCFSFDLCSSLLFAFFECVLRMKQFTCTCEISTRGGGGGLQDQLGISVFDNATVILSNVNIHSPSKSWVFKASPPYYPQTLITNIRNPNPFDEDETHLMT